MSEMLLSVPSAKAPTEQELQSHHATLQTMLLAHGELTRNQSDYAVYLADKLERTVQAEKLPDRQSYYDYYMNHDLDHLRDGLPVFRKASAFYPAELRHYIVPHDRSNNGDEYKAVEALAKVKEPQWTEMKPVVRLVAALAMLMSDREGQFANAAAEQTQAAGYASLCVNQPEAEELIKRVFKTAQFDQLNVDFRDSRPVPA